jgi:hypothetical protein
MGRGLRMEAHRQPVPQHQQQQLRRRRAAQDQSAAADRQQVCKAADVVDVHVGDDQRRDGRLRKANLQLPGVRAVRLRLRALKQATVDE